MAMALESFRSQLVPPSDTTGEHQAALAWRHKGWSDRLQLLLPGALGFSVRGDSHSPPSPPLPPMRNPGLSRHGSGKGMLGRGVGGGVREGGIDDQTSSDSLHLLERERELGIPRDLHDDEEEEDDEMWGEWRDKDEVRAEAEAAAAAAAAAGWSGAWSDGGYDLYDAVAQGQVEIV